MRCDQQVLSQMCIGEIHRINIFVSPSFDLIEWHSVAEEHAAMFVCLCKALLIEAGVTHLQNQETWNQSRYQVLL